KVFKGEKADKVPLFELFMDEPVYEYFAGKKIDKNDPLGGLKLAIDAFYNAGYDYASAFACDLNFPTNKREKDKTVSMSGDGIIYDWESFYNYPWPSVDACDFSRLDLIQDYLPSGMKLGIMAPDGLLECVTALVGYVNMCMMLYDDPELIAAIFEKVGRIQLEYFEKAVSYDTVGFLISSDDWGFNTQTLLSIEDLRKYVFPWNKKIVEAAHKKGKPVVLHSCGYMMDIMEDIIEDMKFDAKHSFEDNIFSVEDSYRKWGDRITMLGGLDLQYLSTASCDEIKERSKRMMELSGKNGRYALGTGNSMVNYIPCEKYVAIIEAANEFNFGN
ncbi:MAG: uroporphyrinogen decarboxylase family protein, partial [Oliverpabstia sp.]